MANFFKTSYLGRFPLDLADFWTSDHLSGRTQSVLCFPHGYCFENTHVEATLNHPFPAPPLAVVDGREAALLEEEVVRLRARDAPVRVVDEADVLAEAARVVVADRLGVPEGLEDDVADEEDRVDVDRARVLGRKRVIQRRFNVGVPRARVPEKTFTLRDRSER